MEKNKRPTRFELRIIELVGYLEGLNYTKDCLYLTNLTSELRIYLDEKSGVKE